ncbi:DEKNAAC100919 [Brettanomyces naardenensis]|uniref:DEKNAAC100920 n=1 Tax=Brettanomyces naardenensis TaxID=13370 RepID=A0A448YGM4_BRENA|nr:DEKNAAC100919 [Brettanomyces naardenensis]
MYRYPIRRQEATNSRGGKTFVFTKLIPELVKVPFSRIQPDEERGNGILILVHRKELADQAIRSIRRCKELEKCHVFLEMAKATISSEELEAERDNLFVVVASVPTLARSKDRILKFSPNQFRAIIVDECHHAVSGSYLQVLEHFGCMSKDGTSPFLLGFSATLQRHDKKPLRKVFDEIVYEKTMLELVDEGYLVDCDWKMVQAGFDLSSVEVGYDGDYKMDCLAKHVDTDEINQLALKTYKHFERLKGLSSTLIFCCNVEHMQNLGELFRMNGIDAQYVTGNTKMLARSDIVDDFKKGEIKVLINCGVFTEGTDLPNIDSIMLLRPTKSRPLLTQMVGRGLRLSEGKDKCLVVDFVEGNDTGLTMNGTLGGITVENPIGSIFGGSGGHGGNSMLDVPLEKQPDYVEFRTFEGFKDLVKLWGENDDNQSNRKIQRQVYKAMAISQDAWIQTRTDSWALKMNGSHYYRLDVDRKQQKVKLIHVSMVLSTKGMKAGRGGYVKIPYNREVLETDDVNKALEKMALDIGESAAKKEMYEAECNRRFYFGNSEITQKQHSFLLKSIEETINPTKQCHVDLDKFRKAVSEELRKVSKFGASNLIFAYTISRKKALQIWVSRHVLGSKESRLKVMKPQLGGEAKLAN